MIFVLISIVIFLNGLTDAPNAIATCVSSKALSVKKAVILAGIFNFFGVFVMTIISPKVAETIFSLINVENLLSCWEQYYLQFSPSQKFINYMNIFNGLQLPFAIQVCLISALLSIILWTIITWFFGIPTSESHSLIASLTGSAFAICNNLAAINFNIWCKIIVGLLFSSIFGFILSYIICLLFSCISDYNYERKRLFLDRNTVIIKLGYNHNLKNNFENRKKNKDFGYCWKKVQIISACAMAFMHGAQDGQKFMALYLLAIFPKTMMSTEKNYSYSFSNLYIPDVPLWIMLLASILMALGTFLGGGRIIQTVAFDMTRLNYRDGFSADCSAFLCMLPASLLGIPLSTTHTKTCAILGASLSASRHYNRATNPQKTKRKIDVSCTLKKRQDAIDWHLAFDIVIAWILTFPICILLGFFLAKMLLLFLF